MSATASNNIFTWQQAMVNENWTNLQQLVKHHYDKHRKIIEDVQTKLKCEINNYEL